MDSLIKREKYLLGSVHGLLALISVLLAGELFLSLSLFLGAAGYLYLAKNMRPGDFEIGFPRRIYIFSGGVFFLAIIFLLFAAQGQEAYFWLVLQFFLFLCLVFINYRPVMILYLSGGFAGVTAGMTVNTFIYLSLGLALFLFLYLLGSLLRLQADLSAPPKKDELDRMSKYTLFQGLLVFIPLAMMNLLRRGIRVDFPGLKEYFEPLAPEQIEPVLPRFLTVIIALVGGTILMGILIWLMRRLFSGEESEEVEKLVMPREAEVEKEQQSTRMNTIKPVIRGGLSGRTIEAIHSFITRAERRGWERKEGETVSSYFGRLVDKLALDLSFDPLVEVYNKSRYSPAHPPEEAVKEAERRLNRIERKLEENES